MTPEQLKNSILQLAIQGKLVEQRKEEGTSEELFKEIQKEKQKLIEEGMLKKQKALPEIKEDEIPFDIPENWKWVKLIDLVSILGDGIHGTPKYSSSGDYYFINGNNLNNGKIELRDTTKRVDQQEWGKFKKNLDLNTILISINGTIGNIAFYDHEKIMLGKSVCYFNVILTELKNYLVFLLKSDYFFKYALHSATGTTIKNISLKAMSNFIIPLPPLAEQKRIVEKLEELLPLVDRYEKAWTRFEELNKKFPLDMQKSILQEAIQGKLVNQRKEEGSGEELFEEIRKEKQKLIEEGKLKKKKSLPEITKDETPFDIPETWKWVRLGDVIKFSIGKTPPRAETEWWSNDFPWVAISDMSDYGFVESTKERVSINAVNKKFFEVASKETLLMSFKLTVGRTSILKIDAVHNEAIVSIFPFIDNNYSLRNMLFYILPIISQWGDSKNAIKGKTLNTTSINNLLVPLPPLAEQKRIVEKIEELLPLCEKLK